MLPRGNAGPRGRRFSLASAGRGRTAWSRAGTETARRVSRGGATPSRSRGCSMLTHVPLLAVQRELYDLPRGMDRFRKYLGVMTGGTDDIVLPLGGMNPMGKHHVPDPHTGRTVIRAGFGGF